MHLLEQLYILPFGNIFEKLNYKSKFVSIKATHMYAESRKIHLIEKLQKADDDAVLAQLETIFKNAQKTQTPKPSIYDFLGVMSAKDTSKMKKAIEETCETVHTDDWK